MNSSSMALELLWTDQCFLGLVALCLLTALYGLKRAPTRKAYLRILKNPIGISAGMVVFLFLMIAVIDSIHFRPMEEKGRGLSSISQSKSVLDNLLSPLDEQYERTYSAPLALTLYNTETVVVEGKTEQVYPRLNFVAEFLKTPEDVAHFVRYVVQRALVLSLLGTLGVWIGVLIVSYLVRHSRGLWPGKISVSALVTLFCCLFLIITSYWLSRELHVLGTGKIGQDIFYYTVKSVRTGLVIGMLTTLFMLPLALLLGIAAGYFGGIVDDIIQYIYTTLSSIPGVLLITASVLSMQTYIATHPAQFTTLAQSADARLLALCLILGVTSWTSLCRLLRAETLKLREIDYVLAARALGSRPFQIIRRHLLPNVAHIVLITLVLDFSFLVLAEAVLSYVGVGVSPLTISWGNMINAARLELARDPVVWWPMTGAFLLMFLLVLAINLLADTIRDAFDPHRAAA